MSEAGAFAAPGVPLLQLTDISHLRFTVQVPEAELNLFESGKNFNIRADQYPDRMLDGKISLVGSKGNGASLFPVQFLVKNNAGLKIKAGMFGKVQLSNEMRSHGILIPSSAIVGSDLQPQVYVLKEGKASLTPVSYSQRVNGDVLVATGLQPGNILITGGFINLYDRASVRTQ
ncbi:MAG TPA: efflux RND transporter periplasmic adaptor subunit, partial [Chitinophagaceae bacterium]